MATSRTLKHLIRMAAAGIAAVCAVGAADAAQFRGTWDPVYLGPKGDGSPFSGDGSYLYFSGEVIVETGSCTSAGTFTSCVGWQVVSAQLVLGTSDVNGTPIAGGPQQTMNFVGTATNPQLTSISIDGVGTLTGVTTSDFFSTGVQGNTDATLASWSSTTALSTFGNVFSFSNLQPYFSLSFSEDYVIMGWKLNPNTSWTCTASNPWQTQRTCGGESSLVTYAPIPEPSTYALMGLGLAAVVAMRRRATRKAAQA